MFDLFNLALLVFINKVRMGILNKSCVPLIWDCCRELVLSRQPCPSLEGGEGPGPAVHTGPAEAPSLSCRCPAAGPRKEVPGTRPVVGREFVPCLVFRRNVPTTFNVRILTKRELCKHIPERSRSSTGKQGAEGCRLDALADTPTVREPGRGRSLPFSRVLEVETDFMDLTFGRRVRL